MSDSKKVWFPQPWFVLNGLESLDMVSKAGNVKQYNEDYKAVVQNMSNTGEINEYFTKFPAPEWYTQAKDLMLGLHKFRYYKWSDNKYIKDKDELMGRPVLAFFSKGNDIRDKVTKDCLSQWYRCEFIVDGIKYNCMEQYMMAQKALLFGDMYYYFKIMSSENPRDMKNFGRQARGFEVNVWDAVKMDIVRTGNYHKFSQNPKLRDFLLGTGDMVIVEASPWDKVWGAGIDTKDKRVNFIDQWPGRNLLGFCLMQVRDNIRAVYANYDEVDLSKSCGLVVES